MVTQFNSSYIWTIAQFITWFTSNTASSCILQPSSPIVCIAVLKTLCFSQFGTVTFSGQLSSLLSIFEGLVKRASDDSSSSMASKSAGNSCAPLYSSILLRLQLLDPTEGRKLMGFERGDAPSSNEARLMNVEAIRRLSLSGWPHWGYE